MGTYRVAVTAGPYAWTVTDDDPPGYGLADPFKVSWSLPTDAVRPSQPDPTVCQFAVVAPTAAAVRLGLGDQVTAAVWFAADTLPPTTDPPDVSFRGRITDGTTTLTTRGDVLTTFACSDQGIDLTGADVGAAEYPPQTWTARLAAFTAAAAPALAGGTILQDPRIAAGVDPALWVDVRDSATDPVLDALTELFGWTAFTGTGPNAGATFYLPIVSAGPDAATPVAYDALPDRFVPSAGAQAPATFGRRGGGAPPEIVGVNLVLNPSFEVALSPPWYEYGDTTHLIDTSTKQVGASSLRCTSNTMSWAGVALLVPVTPGDTLHISAYTSWFRPYGLNLKYDWRNAAQETIGTSPYYNPPSDTPAWSRYAAPPVVVPAGAAYVLATWFIVPTVAGDAFNLDAVLVNTGPAPVDYFDGDTPDTADDVYAWTGTPHGSTSTHISSGCYGVLFDADDRAAGVLDACFIEWDVAWTALRSDVVNTAVISWATAAAADPTLDANERVPQTTRVTEIPPPAGRAPVLSTRETGVLGLTSVAGTVAAAQSNADRLGHLMTPPLQAQAGWSPDAFVWRLDRDPVGRDHFPVIFPQTYRAMTQAGQTMRAVCYVRPVVIMNTPPAWNPMDPDRGTVYGQLAAVEVAIEHGAPRVEFTLSPTLPEVGGPAGSRLSWNATAGTWDAQVGIWDDLAPGYLAFLWDDPGLVGVTWDQLCPDNTWIDYQLVRGT